MKRHLPSGLGLTLLTAGCTTLSLWLLLALPPVGMAGPPSSEEEPPPSRTLWDRIGDRANSLLHRHEPGSAREEVRQAALRLGVVDWQRAGHGGKGVKVAILDSGFRGYKDALGDALPASVTVKSFRKDGDLEARQSQHGILCGEVVHHLAPDAEILFANWEPEKPEKFLEAVRWARREGAQIISCSIIMPTWSDGEGGGSVHRELTKLLGDGSHKGDALFFASAGNTALRHWGGAFAPGRDGLHQWSRGRKENAVRPMTEDRVSVELYGSGETCYELTVRDTSNDRDVESVRTAAGGGSFNAAVRFVPREGERYAVRVSLVSAPRGKQPANFHLTVLNGKLNYASAAGSIPFPGDGGEVVALAAVDGKGRRQSYSSCGPNGASEKPDLSAVVPFPSVFRPEQPFSGTSAAAPQGAALAALMWGRDSTLTAADVRQALTKAAAPTGKKGHCTEAGHGVLKLP